jgi:hypothetical protein
MPSFDLSLILLTPLALSACSLEVPGSGPWDGGAFEVEAGGSIGSQYAEGGSGGSPAGEIEGGSASADAGHPGSDAAVGCAIDGRYAVEVSFDVSWVGTQFASIVPIISPGEGQLSFIVIGELKQAAVNTELAFRTCQASVPEFISTLPQERYAVRFSDSVWDNPNMPIFRSEVMSCREPGCMFRSTPIHALIGSALSDPLAEWPSSAASGQWPDHDGDGRPGVGAFMLGPSAGRSIAYPPVDLFGLRRVQKLDLGMRVNLTLNGKRDSCDALSGEILDGSIDTRGLNCIATSRPMACSADELRFLDDNLPAWTVRQGTFRGMRVKDDADCDQVRQLYGFVQASP